MEPTISKPQRVRTPLGDVVTTADVIDELTGQHRQFIEIAVPLTLVKDAARFDDNNPGRNWPQ